jgi:ionotropic glutamate receptor
VNAVLMMDAVDVIIHGLTSLLVDSPEVFRNTFRRGQVFNNETRGIQCRRYPPSPWIYGRHILNHLRRVKFLGLTGPVAFDPVTGHRANFVLDVMALSFNSQLKKVSVITHWQRN